MTTNDVGAGGKEPSGSLLRLTDSELKELRRRVDVALDAIGHAMVAAEDAWGAVWEIKEVFDGWRGPEGAALAEFADALSDAEEYLDTDGIIRNHLDMAFQTIEETFEAVEAGLDTPEKWKIAYQRKVVEGLEIKLANVRRAHLSHGAWKQIPEIEAQLDRAREVLRALETG